MSGENEKTEDKSQTSDSNAGSGDNRKMVPESTLISIRKGYTDEIKKLRESLDAEVQKTINMQSNLDSLTEMKSKFETLQSEHKGLSERFYIGELHRASLLTERVESLRSSVAARAGIKPEVLKEKNYDQLVAFNESLDLMGKPKSSEFVSKVNSGDKTTMTKREVMTDMLEEAKEKSRGGKS